MESPGQERRKRRKAGSSGKCKYLKHSKVPTCKAFLACAALQHLSTYTIWSWHFIDCMDLVLKAIFLVQKHGSTCPFSSIRILFPAVSHEMGKNRAKKMHAEKWELDTPSCLRRKQQCKKRKLFLSHAYAAQATWNNTLAPSHKALCCNHLSCLQIFASLGFWLQSCNSGAKHDPV